MDPRTTLTAFDRYLADRGLALDAVVVGGTALNLLGVIARQTRDCDILHPALSAEVVEASRAFATEIRPRAGSSRSAGSTTARARSRALLPAGWELTAAGGLPRAGAGLALAPPLRPPEVEALRARATARLDLPDCLAMAPTAGGTGGSRWPGSSRRTSTRTGRRHVRSTLARPRPEARPWPIGARSRRPARRPPTRSRPTSSGSACSSAAGFARSEHRGHAPVRLRRGAGARRPPRARRARHLVRRSLGARQRRPADAARRAAGVEAGPRVLVRAGALARRRSTLRAARSAYRGPPIALLDDRHRLPGGAPRRGPALRGVEAARARQRPARPARRRAPPAELARHARGLPLAPRHRARATGPTCGRRWSASRTSRPRRWRERPTAPSPRRGRSKGLRGVDRRWLVSQRPGGHILVGASWGCAWEGRIYRSRMARPEGRWLHDSRTRAARLLPRGRHTPAEAKPA